MGVRHLPALLLLDRSAPRLKAKCGTAVRPERIERMAPTRTDRVNLHGVFRFPVKICAERLLPDCAQAMAAGDGLLPPGLTRPKARYGANGNPTRLMRWQR